MGMSEEQTEVTMTADSKEKSKQKRRFIGRPPKIVLFGILVVALIGFGAGAYLWKANEGGKVVFTIEGKKYREDEVRELIKYPVENENMSEEDAAKQVFEYLKIIKTAENRGMIVSGTEVSRNVERVAESESFRKSHWARLLAAHDAIQWRVTNAVSDRMIDGYLYIFRFGERIERGYDFVPEGYMNEALIQEDREYANSQAKTMRRVLESKKISPDEVLQKVKDDPRLGYSNKKGTNQSMAFTEQGLSHKTGVLALPQSLQKLLSSKDLKPGVSEIKAGKTLADVTLGSQQEITEEDLKETYYYFTYISNISDSIDQHELKKLTDQMSAEYRGLKG